MKDLWFVFVWCAVFSAVASAFQKLLDLTAEKKRGERFSRRDALRLGVELFMVGFYGGLAGWALMHLFPGMKPELLGICSAVLGSGGPKVTRRFLGGMVEKATGLKLEEGDGSAA